MPLKGRPYKSADIEHFTSAAPIESYFFANFSIICFFVCVWVRFFMLRVYSWWGRGTDRYVIFDDGCDNRREKALLTRTWLSVNVLLSYVPCLCAVFLAVEICDRCLLDGFTRYDFRLFCSRDIAIAVKFTVSHSPHPWHLDNKNYKQIFLIMLNGNGLNQCFFVFMQ